MRRLCILAVVVVLGLGLFSARTASAQVSIWLQKGVSGVGGSLQFTTSDSVSTYGVDAGYSYEGFLDFDIVANYLSYPSSQQVFSDQRVYSAGPTIQYHPLKQTKDMPISLSVGLGYQKLFFSSDTLNAQGGSLDAWSVAANASVYRFFRLGDNTGVIPAVGLTFAHTETSGTAFAGSPTITNTSDDLGVTLAGYFAYIDDAGHIYGVVPTITLGDHVSFGVSIGFVYSLL